MSLLLDDAEIEQKCKFLIDHSIVWIFVECLNLLRSIKIYCNDYSYTKFLVGHLKLVLLFSFKDRQKQEERRLLEESRQDVYRERERKRKHALGNYKVYLADVS